MWLYDSLKPWGGPLMLLGFFKRLYLTNFEGIEPGKPVFLAVNHPTGFVEPIILSVHSRPGIFHMTRGDLFAKPWARKLLTAVNMFPVYRMREGFKDSKRNEEVFAYCDEMMRRRKCLAIYVEGRSEHEKRLRPLQKGLARFAFSAYEKHRQDDLQILPVGANYTYAEQWRSEAMVVVGEPIFVKDHWASFEANPTQAIADLTALVEAKLRPLVIEIAPADEAMTDQLFQLYRNERYLGFGGHVLRSPDRFLDEKTIASRASGGLSESVKGQLWSQLMAYFSKLEAKKITDFGLCQQRLAGFGWSLFAVLLFLPAAIGRILAWPPAALTMRIVRKKVRNIEFRSSVMIGAGFASFLLYFLAIFIASLFTGKAIWVMAAALLPVLSLGSVLYWDFFEGWLAAWRAASLDPNERNALLGEREKIEKMAFSGLSFRIQEKR